MPSASTPVATLISASTPTVSVPGIDLLLAQALVNIDGDNLVTSAGAVTEMVNQGTGGADYDLDVVVGTGANLKPHPSDSVLLYGASGDFASSPDSVASSILGDIEIIVRFNLDDYTPSVRETLVAKFSGSGDSSYILQVEADGKLRFLASPDGSDAASVIYTSTASITALNGPWLKLSLDVDNGSSGSDLTYSTSTDETFDPNLVNFTPLGDVVTKGVTTIHDGADPLAVGAISGGAGQNVNGSISRALILNGIDGTLAVDFNAADYINKTSDTQFPSSATGEVWTLNGNTFIQNTGKQVVHSIGSAGLETTAGQDITQPLTIFAVARFSDTTPTNDQMIGSRSVTTKRVTIYSRDSASDKFTLSSDTNLILDGAFDNNAHVFTAQVDNTNSVFTVSGIESKSGTTGDKTWDFASLFLSDTGTNSMQGYIATLIAYDRQLSASEINNMQQHLRITYNLPA